MPAFRFIFAYGLVFFLSVCSAASTAQAAVRIALLCRGDIPAGVISKVKERFTPPGDVDLIDRAELATLQDDRKMAGDTSATSQEIVDLAKSMHADVIAVIDADLEAKMSNSEWSVTAFDAASGVRLIDTAVSDSEEIDATSSAIADQIISALKKRDEQQKTSHVLCVLTSRNVDLPESASGFCESMTALFERELVHSKSMVLLERQQRSEANGANLTTTTRPAISPLVAAAITISLDLARAGSTDSNDVVATAMLHDVSGRQVASTQARGKLDDALPLAEALAKQVLEAVSGVKPETMGKADVHLEAARFEREVRFRMSHGDWSQGAGAADAACALDPANTKYQINRARCLVMAGVAAFEPNVMEDTFVAFLPPKPSDADLTAGLRLLHRGTAEMLAAGRVPGSRVELAKPLDVLEHLIGALLQEKDSSMHRPDRDGIFASPSWDLNGQQLDQLTLVVRDYRRYLDEVDEPQARDAVHDEETFTAYSAVLLRLLGDECHIFAGTSNQYTTQVAKRMAIWAKLAAKFAPTFVKTYGPAETLTQIAAWNWCTTPHDWLNMFRPACFGTLDATDAANWKIAIDAMEQAGAPQRFYSSLRQWDQGLTAPPQVAHAAAAAPKSIAAAPAPSAQKNPIGLLYTDEQTLVNVDAINSGLSLLNKPLLVEDQLYVAALAINEVDHAPEVRLLQLPADGGAAPKLLSRVSIDQGLYDQIKGDKVGVFQARHFLGDSRFALCLEGYIITLSLSTGAGQCISTAQFPGNYPQAITDLGDVLFIVMTGADHGSYLISYNLKSHEVQTLASSRRREIKSPFDNLPPMAVPYMASDMPRNRIVFFAYHSQWDNATKGLWEYSAATGKFNRLRSTTYSRKEDEGGYEIAGSPVVDHTFVLYTNPEPLVYNLASDSVSNNIPPHLRFFHGDYLFPKVFHDWWHLYGDPGGSGVGFGDNTIEQRIGDVRAFSELWQGGYPLFAEDRPDDHLLIADGTGVWLVKPLLPNTQDKEKIIRPDNGAFIKASIGRGNAGDSVELSWSFPHRVVTSAELESECLTPDADGKVENYQTIFLAPGGENGVHTVTELKAGNTYRFRIRPDLADGSVDSYVSTEIRLPDKK